MEQDDLTALLDRIIDTAGGFSDHPADKGGPTTWGITEAVARRHGYVGPMRELPPEVARDIYRETYFMAPRIDEVAAINWPVAAKLFDCGVNMGTATAAKFLQRALNVLATPQAESNAGHALDAGRAAIQRPGFDHHRQRHP